MTKHFKIGAIALFPFLLVGAASCQTAGGGDPSGSCREADARALAGMEKISDADARRLTGAKFVRQIKPGDPVTMDLNPDRVTIENDPETGVIVRASCG